MKDEKQKIYGGNPPRNNQDRSATVKTTMDVKERPGSLYSGKADHDEKSKTR